MHKPVKAWTEEQEGRQYRMTLYRISSGGKQFHVVNRRPVVPPETAKRNNARLCEIMRRSLRQNPCHEGNESS